MRNLRVLSNASKPNDGSRSLYDSILVPEVEHALKVWTKSQPDSKVVLIGGIAFSYYAKPRATTDVDLLFLSEDDIPVTVSGMKRISNLGFREDKTHVEVDACGPRVLSKVPSSILKKVFHTSRGLPDAKIRIATPEGLIALKLYTNRLKDEADIIELLKACSVSMKGWPISGKERTKLLALTRKAKQELDEEENN